VTLSGVDVSSHQTSTELASWLPRSSFVIVKASEGRTYVDKSHDVHVAAARKAGKLVGHYHFARPDNNGPTAEAEHFVATAKPRPGDVLVLDFEPYRRDGSGLPSIDLGVAPEWILGFMARVEQLTKAPCWLYIDGNMGRQVLAKATAAQADAMQSRPLWKATYGAAPGSLLGWSTLTAWQWASSPIDRNTFYGDASTWRKLAVPTPPKPPTQEDDMTPEQAKQLDEVHAWLSEARSNAPVRYIKPDPSDPTHERYVLARKGEAGARIALQLDELHGNYVQQNIGKLRTKLDELAAAVAELRKIIKP
jgi:GH25 family lysozyme M1 (1,4-beta-N-acetylmuramidase)